MGLVQSTFLAGLAALAIPLIVHLLFRFRTRRVELGTIRFLGEVIKKNARRKKIKRYVLLAMRLAALALIVLLFARPYLNAQGSGSAERLVTILIDASATMTLETDSRPRVAKSVAEARHIIATSGKGTRLEVATFDTLPRPLGDGGEVSLDDALDRIDTEKPGYRGTNYAAALAWARDIANRAGSERKELHLFSDLQRSGLEWADTDPMPSDVAVTIHDLGRDSVNNVAVISADMAASLVRPGDPIKLTVTLANFGPFDLSDTPVKLYLQSERNNISRRQRVSLASGALETFEFELKSLEPGLWKGFVEVEVDDELAFDNRRYTAVNVAPPWKVLVVDGEPHESPSLAETYYLRTALRLAREGSDYDATPYDPQVIEFTEPWPADLSEFAIVVLANAAEVSPAKSDDLDKFVAAGGGLVVFTGENVTAEGYQGLAAAGLGPGKIGQPRFAGGLSWRIDEWDETHSIFAPFNDPQHGDLRRIAFNAYTKIDPSDNANVLASFRGGDPLLIEVPHDKGSALYMTTASDRAWSDLPRRRLYLPIVHQLLGHLTGLNDGGPVRHTTMGIDPESDDATPGVYDRGQYWEVINTNPRESDPDRCTIEELLTRFDLKQAAGTTNTETATASIGPTTGELRADEVWHWIIFALLGILGAEFFLANRTTA